MKPMFLTPVHKQLYVGQGQTIDVQELGLREVSHQGLVPPQAELFGDSMHNKHVAASSWGWEN